MHTHTHTHPHTHKQTNTHARTHHTTGFEATLSTEEVPQELDYGKEARGWRTTFLITLVFFTLSMGSMVRACVCVCACVCIMQGALAHRGKA